MSLNILIKKNFSQIDNLSPPLSLYIEWKLVQSSSDTNILLWFFHNSFCQSSQDSSLKFCLSFQIPRRLHVLTKTKVKKSAQNVFFLQLWFPIHSSFVVSWVPIGSPPTCGSRPFLWACAGHWTGSAGHWASPTWAKGQNLGQTGHHPTWAIWATPCWVWSRV